MNVENVIVNLNSPNPERLISFYSGVVQLPPREGMGPGAFSLGGDSSFVIDGHSDVRGQAERPERVLLNFVVGDIASEHERLASAGVKVVRDKGREPWGGIISTFEDPDGNYFQLMEYRPELAQGSAH
jgi:predicted enzyme related to lactoylglutathione lyase